MSWPREDPEPVEPSSGPMRENRRQRRRKTGSKTKKSKDRRAAADPSTDSQSVNGSGMALALFLSSSTKEGERDGPRQYDASTSWGHPRWPPPPELKQRAGGSCLPCSERAKRCTGKKNSGQPCP
ncbi:hypothetical protein CERSUDRAFT_101449 [Gelatoporia subvermispora B]|uniref:Uncharacterized protein n=1 Tax=Ceriporiopsis subvermispora (strain B) TaxID=914234 RepID=M2QWQ7_CERS8|nr:hypothetical protein CERSUDRAFT_101449 [Gelatoporia subvermispora B]